MVGHSTGVCTPLNPNDTVLYEMVHWLAGDHG